MAVKVDTTKCDGCKTCEEGCPNSSIKVENGKAVVTDECIDCGSCVASCPQTALSAA